MVGDFIFEARSYFLTEAMTLPSKCGTLHLGRTVVPSVAAVASDHSLVLQLAVLGQDCGGRRLMLSQVFTIERCNAQTSNVVGNLEEPMVWCS